MIGLVAMGVECVYKKGDIFLKNLQKRLDIYNTCVII